MYKVDTVTHPDLQTVSTPKVETALNKIESLEDSLKAPGSSRKSSFSSSSSISNIEKEQQIEVQVESFYFNAYDLIQCIFETNIFIIFNLNYLLNVESM